MTDQPARPLPIIRGDGASSRMRALESGRWVLQVAPTGFSAVIEPDGTVDQRTAVSEQAVLQATITTREGTTLYTQYGLLFGVLGAVVSLVLGRGVPYLRARRAAPGDDAKGESSHLDEEGDRPVVHQVDGHVGAEPAGGDGGAQGP